MNLKHGNLYFYPFSDLNELELEASAPKLEPPVPIKIKSVKLLLELKNFNWL